jgi:predicted AAA+ superfamily ATPase
LPFSVTSSIRVAAKVGSFCSADLVVAGSETLAGRIGILELTPFLGRELVNRKIADDRMFWGGFPPVLELADDESRLRWIESYIATFLERDIRDYGFRIPAPRLRRFWTMLAHVHGGILNVSDLARAMDMDQKSILRQLDILEQTLMIRRLEPYFVNISKRLVKAPKLYIRDNGILHFLAGLRTKSDLDVWPRRGSSFESAAIEEFIALARRSVVHPEFFYWRTHAGAEVDLLIKSGKSILPIEFKMGATLDQYSFAALRTVLDDLDLPRAWLVYGGRERRSVGKIEVIPWADVLADRVQIF